MKLLYQKKVYVLTILTLVFMLAGCGAQKTEQVEEAATVPVEEAVTAPVKEAPTALEEEMQEEDKQTEETEVGVFALTEAQAEQIVRQAEQGNEEVVSDFLSMDTETFARKYDKNELYDRDILFCTREAWKYQGEAVDGFMEPEYWYEVDDITAIRFIHLGPSDTDRGVGTEDAENRKSKVENRMFYQYFGDYAVSYYFQEGKSAQADTVPEPKELSFVKIKLSESDSRKTAPRELYERLERWYYETQEEIEEGEWAVSPERTKAVCVSNGSLPKHPSQIFVRCQENIPDTIFRRTWECRFADWLDEEHFICYNDMGPILFHLESDQMEEIRTKEDDYDPYGCRYKVEGEWLIATFLDEEYYRWNIVREEGEIRLLAPNGLQ